VKRLGEISTAEAKAVSERLGELFAF